MIDVSIHRVLTIRASYSAGEKSAWITLRCNTPSGEEHITFYFSDHAYAERLASAINHVTYTPDKAEPK